MTKIIFPLLAFIFFSSTYAKDPATLLFMTDFSLADDAVAICKGAMLAVEPRLRIIDITHQVKAFQIEDAARFLSNTAPYYAKGTVFVVVVDPGVGSSRKAIVAKSKRGQFFVLPDNGLITLIERRDGLEAAREITNPKWMARVVAPTFHGRDLFAPVGARLAKGEDWTAVGGLVASVIRLPFENGRLTDAGVEGKVIGFDGEYGNAISNVYKEEFFQLGYALGSQVEIQFGDKKILAKLARAFSDVAVGESLIYADSTGRMTFAVNQGNFEKTHAVARGTEIKIARSKSH